MGTQPNSNKHMSRRKTASKVETVRTEREAEPTESSTEALVKRLMDPHVLVPEKELVQYERWAGPFDDSAQVRNRTLIVRIDTLISIRHYWKMKASSRLVKIGRRM